MKYLESGAAERHAKTNLTKGAFGVVGAVKRINSIWKKFGVKLKSATPKGKIKAVRVQYKIKKNKYA